MDLRWPELPPALAACLLSGGTGRAHLAGAARLCLEAAAADAAQRNLYARLALETLWAAWACDPLDLQGAASLQALLGSGDAHPTLAALLTRLLRIGSAGPDVRRDESRIHALLDKGRSDEAAALLQAALERTPGSLPLLRLAYLVGQRPEHAAWAQGRLAHPGLRPLDPLPAFLGADLDLVQGEYERAANGYNAVLDTGLLPEAALRLASCLTLLGRREEALQAWARAWRERPWQVNALLCLADRLSGVDTLRAPLPGRVAVLLYSYNKAEDLDLALEAVWASELGDALVAVLDNGSRDATPLVLDRWAERFAARGAGDFLRVDLPVNVGAPAARNWLLELPQVAEREFVVYLDDDALPPPDWLSRLGAGVQRFPEAGVWGCKVVDATAPRTVQSTDLHLKVEGGAARPGGEAPLRVTDLHLEGMDAGQFDYLRPCLSVTGCCHVFRTAVLREAGGFDLRFSPSQFDDLDRDLGLALGGRLAVYQGHLAVRHRKRTGSLGATSAAASLNALGNARKLDLKYGPPERQRLRRLDLEAQLRHVARCEATVRQFLELPPGPGAD